MIIVIKKIIGKGVDGMSNMPDGAAILNRLVQEGISKKVLAT